MSVAAVSSTQAAGTPTAAQLAALNAADDAQGTSSSLTESDFLQLLTTQLQNQDPLQPMSDTDFIAQMATFSQLSAQNTLNTDFSSYSSAQAISNAQSYIGENVSVSGAAEGDAATSGIVTGITVSNGAPELTIGGVNYALTDITGIQPGSAASATASSSTATPSSTSTPASSSTSTSTSPPSSTSTPTTPASNTSTAPTTAPASTTTPTSTAPPGLISSAASIPTASNTSSTAPATTTTTN
jgi:flagellar basal-body rod modification protein FlgD